MSLRADQMNIRLKSRTMLEGRRNSRELLRFITFLTLALGCSLGLMATHRFLTTHRYFQISEMEVLGLHHLSSRDIVRISGLRIGDNIFRADLSSATERLLRQPWIADASVSRRFPQTISIQIEEREPFAILDSGGLFIVDREGAILQPYSGRVDMGLPTIRLGSGKESRKEIRENLEITMPLVRRAISHEFLKGMGISRVDIPKPGRVALHMASNGLEIRMAEGYTDEQVSRLKALMEQSGVRPEEIKYIDLSYSDRIVMGFN